MPKVSVIIPVHNTEKFIEKCLDSVCNQTLSDIEIICINDASTDNSLEILKRYAAKDDRIKVVNFEENKGAAAARNTGIDAATGEYIGFVDSDDFIDAEFYEKLYNKAVDENADVAKGNIYDYNGETGVVELTDFYDMNDKIRENKFYFHYGFTSAIYKTEFIKNNCIHFPIDLIYFEDPYFSIMALLKYNTLVIVDDAKYYYTINPDSVSKNVNTEKIKDLIKSVDKIFELIVAIDNEEDYSILFDFLCRNLWNWYREYINDIEISHSLSEAIFNLLIRCSFNETRDRNFALVSPLLPKSYISKFLRYRLGR